MSKTCIPCRNRKVKCDNEKPTCGTCFKSRLRLTCIYEPTEWDRVKALAKREACFPCRRKKRRCDAVRPFCGPCQGSPKDACVYERGPLDSRRFERDHEGKLHEIQSTVIKYPLVADLLPPLSPVDAPGDIQQFPAFGDISSQHFFIPSFDAFLIPSIIRPPSLSIDDNDDPYKFALSEVSLTDLDMEFRVLFISRRLTYGIFMTPAKESALLMGDLSGTIIHPFFVHLAHLAGCVFYQERRLGRYGLLSILAGHFQLTLAALATMKEEDDPLALARAYWAMTIAHVFPSSVSAAQRYLFKSMEVIRRNNLRFIRCAADNGSQLDSIVSPVVEEFSEEVHERVAYLADMLHVETYVYIAGQPGGPYYYHSEDFYKNALPKVYSELYQYSYDSSTNEKLLSDLEVQFRYELPDAYPLLFEICPIVLRVRSMLLVKDASNIIAWFYQQPTPSAAWLSTCQTFLIQLTTHIDSLSVKLAQSKLLHDGERCLPLRYCSIISLTALTLISHTLSKNPFMDLPLSSEFRSKCVATLTRIFTLVDELEPLDFQYLDPFLALYWTRAITLLRSENQASPTTATGPLEDPSYLVSQWSTTSASSPSSSDDSANATSIDSNLDMVVDRLEALNIEFSKNRHLPGTTSLCETLAKQTASKRKGS